MGRHTSRGHCETAKGSIPKDPIDRELPRKETMIFPTFRLVEEPLPEMRRNLTPPRVVEEETIVADL
jgi:hypothetical protein